ncbi:hypothetical protein GCM10023169_23310 [Georgenia halophila]|uniref:ParB-like N-terminal domain-containing protein n=1 Tax=Georgenia halophila TaxID=620889 RepID=A0ABP8LBU3_9MICO
MSEKRRGLGRGIGALIPSAPAEPAAAAEAAVAATEGATITVARPVDVFFPSSGSASSAEEAPPDGDGSDEATAERASSRSAARSLMEPGKKRTKTRPTARSSSAKSTDKPASKTAARSASKPATDSGATPTAKPGAKATARSAARPAASTGRPTTEAPESVEPPEVASGESASRPAEAESTAGPDIHLVRSAAADDRPTQAATQAEDEAPRSHATTPTAGDSGEGLVPVPGASYADLPVDQIVPNQRQPRQVFDEEELEELAASIREVGVLQPVVVRPMPEPDENGAGYELIMGERRWRASKLAGNDTVPAIVRETSESDLLRDALLENLHRSNLNPLEEAAAYHQLLEDFGCTHDELATRIARSRPQISNTLRLIKLPPLVQRRVAAGVLSAGHARALLGLSDGAAMERLAQKIVAEGLSVRATEEIVALGDEPVEPEMRRRPRTNAHTEDLNRLATRLSDRLDTRVKVNLGQRKGRIAVEFASVEDLNRILDVLAPGEEHITPDVG